jgi:two-component system cell cycle response regulator
MALRVLLADESISIKKVIQLSLQDYGTEVKSVPVGIDVPEAARTFEPDIIFIDILLSKKSGYDVARELKAQQATQHIPIVLMWSGFMELDPKKAAEAQADGQLEKPFDADQLRNLVKKLVPRLAGNTISNYLQFPQRPEFEEPQAPQPAAPKAPAAQPPAAQEFNSDSFALMDETAGETLEPVEMDAPEGLQNYAEAPTFKPPAFDAPTASTGDDLPFLAEMDEPEDFQQVPLPRARGKQPLAEEGDESWMESKLSDFLVEIPEDAETSDNGDGDLTSSSIAVTGGETEVMLMDLDKPDWNDSQLDGTRTRARATEPQTSVSGVNAQTSVTRQQPQQAPAAPRSSALGKLSEEKIEAIAREEIRAQTQQVLEDIAWKIIPEMAERIIREELAKLMKESEDLAP